MNRKISEIGIGQNVITPYRYKYIEYLPWMFIFEFVVQSKRPEAINSYDALIYPFDVYIWGFTGFSTLATFLALVFIQKCWIHASGNQPPGGWVFQGNLSWLLSANFYYLIDYLPF